MYQPWLAHLFPGVTLASLEQGSWSMSSYLAMADFAREHAGG
jgi:hypothetical protein